jgi:molybdopterin synthase sulfur carrier subunit
MAVTVYIPTPFRRATRDRDRVEATADSVGALLDQLERAYPDLKGLVRNAAGEVHPHINLYVNHEAIEGVDTRLADGDEVAIIPALAGGAG